MTTLTVVNIGELFKDISQQMRDMDYESVMLATLELLADDERAMFDAGVDPNGVQWAPNSPATVKKKGYGIPLFESGALEQSLVEVGGPGNIHETSHRGLLFGTEVPYSIFNQEGTSRIPARPHVGMREKLIDAVCDEIADFVVESLKE